MPPEPRALPRAPADALGPTGPRFGAYAGSLGKVDLSSLAPEGMMAGLRHAARLKRWQRVVLVTEGHLVVVGVLAAGPLVSGSTWVVDRATGAVLFDRTASGLPGLTAAVGDRPGAGARVSFVAPGMALSLERRSDRFQLAVDLGDGLALEARLETRGAPEPFSLVAPLPESGLRAAQVAGPLAVEGWLTVRGQTVDLSGGRAALDYGAGLFPREAAWRKVTALGAGPGGAPLLLQLCEGLGPPGGEDETFGDDVLLSGDGPRRLPPVAVEADPQAASAPWRLVSLDGAVDLTFQPQATHREGRRLLLLSLELVQLAGTLSGRVPGPDGRPLQVEGLAALAEDLTARW